MLSRDQDFSFWGYIKADMHRFYCLTRQSDECPGWYFLLGLCSPRFMPNVFCRSAYWCYCYRLSPVAKIFSLMNFILFGIEIGVRCPIGPGLVFPHTQGTVIGAWSIGSNATVLQGVTLGARELDFVYAKESRPILGDNVTVGAGAKVLGCLSVGDNTVIGANSVVLNTLPANVVAAGVPAQIVKRLDQPVLNDID